MNALNDGIQHLGNQGAEALLANVEHQLERMEALHQSSVRERQVRLDKMRSAVAYLEQHRSEPVAIADAILAIADVLDLAR